MKFTHPGLWLAIVGLTISGFAQADFNRGQPAGFENRGLARGGDRGGRDNHRDGRDGRRDDRRGSGKVCFYDQPNYRGNSFCMDQGQQLDTLVPSGWNDRIASAYAEGRVEVVVYNDINFRSLNLTLTGSEPDLRAKMQYWGISSIIFKAPPSDPLPGGDDGRGRGDGRWDGRDDPRSERDPRICFFDQPNFRGNTFCMKPGESINNLVPSGWNDRIKSFVIHGFVEAVLWNDVGPHGVSKNVTRSDNFTEAYWGVSAIQVLTGPSNPFGR
jgi:hypothetical protein